MTTAREQDLAEVFNDAVDYRTAFPKQLANLVISWAADIVYASPEAAARLKRDVPQVRAMIADRTQYMRDQGFVAAAGHSSIKGVNLDYLSFNPDLPDSKFVSAKYPAKMNLIYTYDREIGQLIIKGGNEGAADAFAMLRHLQRFRGKTDIFENAPYMNSDAIFSSPNHYTSAVMQRIESMWKENPKYIQSLSLQDTAIEAKKIARQYTLEDKTLNKIHDAYQPAGELISTGGSSSQIIKTIARIMLENKDDHDIYRAGKLCLGRADVKDMIASDLGSDADFQKNLARMKEHEKESGFILNAADAKDAAPIAGKKAVISKARHLLRPPRQ